MWLWGPGQGPVSPHAPPAQNEVILKSFVFNFLSPKPCMWYLSSTRGRTLAGRRAQPGAPAPHSHADGRNLLPEGVGAPCWLPLPPPQSLWLDNSGQIPACRTWELSAPQKVHQRPEDSEGCGVQPRPAPSAEGLTQGQKPRTVPVPSRALRRVSSPGTQPGPLGTMTLLVGRRAGPQNPLFGTETQRLGSKACPHLKEPGRLWPEVSPSTPGPGPGPGTPPGPILTCCLFSPRQRGQ